MNRRLVPHNHRKRGKAIKPPPTRPAIESNLGFDNLCFALLGLSWVGVKYNSQLLGQKHSRFQCRKETQTTVAWSCLPFIRSGQNHLSRHCERGKKTRQTEEKVARQHQEMDRPGVRQVPEGSGEQGKMEGTGCEIICDAPATLAVKG